MKNALVIVAALCFASFFSVSYGYLAGLQYNFALTEANREDRFDIVVIDPVAGVASSTQKQVYGLYDGVLDISNTVFGPSDWVLSVQAFDYAQAVWGTSLSPLHPDFHSSNPVVPFSQPAYLARQNLNEGGRFEYCQLSATVQPINVFWDTDSSVVATTVNPSGSTLAIHRISFSASSTICATTQLSNIVNANSISINVKHQRGNRIYIVTEHSNTLSSSPFAQIRIYEVSSSASIVSTTQLPNNVFPTTLSTLTPDVIVFQGWSASLSTTGGFGTWEINTTTFTSTTTLTPRSVSSSNEELSFTGVLVNRTNTLHSLKNTGVSATAVTTPIPQIGTTNFHVAAAGETKASAVLNDIRIFALYDFPNATVSTLNVDSSATSSNVLLSGTFSFAGQNTGLGSITRTTISVCRLTYVGGSTTPVTSSAVGTGDNASCSIGTIPLGTTSVDVEFAPDGVNYGPKSSFAYSLNSANALFTGAFRRNLYTFRDGTAAGIREEKITLDAFDNAGRKVLFHPSQSVVLSVQATGNTIVRSVVGNSATVVNGVATFPNFAVDIDRAEANNIAVLTVSASFTTTISTTVTNTFTTTLNVEFLTRTTGTLVALAFPDVTSGSQAFETHLINPTLTKSTPALRLTTRTLTDTTGFLALGLSTYDRDNKVLNTVEINSSTNQVFLVGTNAFGSTTSTRGTGICRLPSTGTNNDLPSAIFYEGTTAADQSTTFLALVNPTDTSLGNGRRLVRYTRTALSTSTVACTVTKVDDLPIFDHYYGNDNVLLLSGGRLAIVESDFFFLATNKHSTFGGSLLSVWRHSVPATSTQAAIPGTFLIRNKVLSFAPISLSQSGVNEIAIAGATATGTISQGIFLVDISTETSTVVTPTGATGLSSSFTVSDNSLAYFLHAGSDVTFADARRRYSGLLNSSNQQTVDTQNLARGLVSPLVATSKDVSTRNYLDFFTVDDPVVTSVSPSRIAVSGTDTITATANNVITSSQLKCRFSSATGIPAPQEFTVGSATTTLTVQNDAATVGCGSFPGTLNGQNAFIYLQLSNDGGNNWGPESRIAVGIITDQANPTVGTVVQTTTARTVQFLVKFFSRITNPTTTQDSNVRAAITTVLNNLASYWSKSAISSAVESDGTTSWSVTLTTTTSSAVRFAGLQATSQTTAQLQSELVSAFNPNGVLHPTLSGAGLTSATVSAVTATATTSSSDDLSDGEIAGIVIGSILGFFLIVGVIAFVVLQSKKNKNTYVAPPPSARARDFTVNSSSYSYDSSDDYSDYTDGETDEDDYSDYI